MNFRRLRYVLILLFSVLFTILKAQDQFCLSVDSASGLVRVTCHPADYTQITFYEITYSDISGFFSGSLNELATGPEDTFIIPGTNAKLNRFLIDVIFHPATVSPYGHALSTIKLAVSSVNTGIARLDWNPEDISLPGTYYIERYEDPVWRLLDTIQYNSTQATLSYNDTITAPFCSLSEVFYRIRFDKAPDGSGCLSVSNVSSGTFRDQTQPFVPLSDTASIIFNPGGANPYPVILGWTDSPTEDVIGYTIYRSITLSGTFVSVGFVVKGINQFTDLTVNPCSDGIEYYYAIVATDGCNNGSPNIFHAAAPHNLLLEVDPISPCEKEAILRWNGYSPMPGGLAGYIILRSENNGNFIAIDTVDSAITEYVDSSGFINGNSYTYMIRAFSAGGTASSSSCQISQVYHGPVAPDRLYISQASVVNDEFIEVIYYSEPANRVKQLVLERSDSPSGPFIVVDSLLAPVNGFLPQQSSFNDHSAQVHQQSYYYRLTMVDSCNKQAMLSENIAQSIYLACAITAANTNLLEWNAYSTWIAGVGQYEVYRTINGIPDPASPLAVIIAPPLEYEDDPNSLVPTSQACYYIRAMESPGNPLVTAAYSVSNLACPVRDPVFYMPNAFRPGGINDRFRPVQAFIDPGSFSMLIYSKWGQLIFETNDLYNGWDGTVNGAIVPMDVYFYRVSYKSLQGEQFDKKGLVTLVQ